MEGYHVKNINLTRTYAKGRAFGVAISDASPKGPPIVAELNNGTIWVLRKRLDLMKPDVELKGNWLLAEGSTPKGVVSWQGRPRRYQEFDGKGIDLQRSPSPSVRTDMDLTFGLGRRAGQALGHGRHRAIWEHRASI